MGRGWIWFVIEVEEGERMRDELRELWRNEVIIWKEYDKLIWWSWGGMRNGRNVKYLRRWKCKWKKEEWWWMKVEMLIDWCNW